MAHVLVVEDEDIIRSLLAEELHSHGLAVTLAADADEAWEILASGTPVDLIFSDVAMPGSMSGAELLRRVHRDFPQIKRVLTSGNPGPENIAGLGLFLPKPFRLEAAARAALRLLGLNAD